MGRKDTPSLLDHLISTTASLVGLTYMLKHIRTECEKSPALRVQIISALEAFVNELKNMK